MDRNPLEKFKGRIESNRLSKMSILEFFVINIFKNKR